MLVKPDHIPANPGVYIFKGAREKILYVGKAKNLKKRLQSYFQAPSRLDARKASLVKEGRDISYIVTANELEAFVLEANLIKQNKPRYNIILRDDKNYPYLKLTMNEKWPRLEVVRKIRKDGALYFGPYVPAGTMWELLNFIRRYFQIRDCNHRFEKGMRACVQYQMGRCPAPCAGLIDREEYMKRIEEVKLFLTGEKKDLLDHLKKRMERLSEELQYENAAKIRDRIRAIEHAWESQKVVDPELGDIDIIGYYRTGIDVVFKVFFIRNGIMTGAKDFSLRYSADLPDRELMQGFLSQLYTKEILPPFEIIVPVMPEEPESFRAWLRKKREGPVRIELPKAGKKRDLLNMASENAQLAFKDKKEGDLAAILKDLQGKLKLGRPVESIGACDISNISGNEAVGAFVYWSEGEFKKERYRRLKIRTISGVDDYAMMREVLERLEENLTERLPDLLIIDGGKGHLAAARKVLEKQYKPAKKALEVIALAKNPDRAYLPEVRLPVDLEDRKQSSLLLKRIRDEAHRFAIGYHRTLRDRELLQSPLQRIPGIGKKRRLELLRVFGSIEEIGKASVDTIASMQGFNRKIAENLLQALRRRE